MPADRERLQKVWETLCWVEADDCDGRRHLWPPQSHIATALLCGVSIATVKKAYQLGIDENWDVPEVDDAADQPVIVETKPCE